jgi:phenylacetic acid degradation operon negative regulatory protein
MRGVNGDDGDCGPDAASTGPVLSRRREVGQSSARSLLMTMLGEFVLPAERPVWTSELVGTLGAFGVEERSARQALARSASEGWIEANRVGRRSRWTLTASGRTLLTEGRRRIDEFGRAGRPWDGRWLVVLVSVPEVRRDLRRRLRTRLTWAGFGSPEAGVWISPHLDREAEAMTALTDLGLAADALSFAATYGAIGQVGRMVARAWDLRRVEERYREFITQFESVAPAGGDETLCAQVRLVHEWRRFPFLDPVLPGELLPAGWEGARAAELFHRCHREWHAAAHRCWDERLAP